MRAPSRELWIVRAATILLLCCTPSLSWAQAIPTPPTAPPSAADSAAAKKHFESGLKLYGEQAYAEAVVAFESSYRLGGRPSALKNLAQAHRSLRHIVEAYEGYEQLLALHEAQLSPADKAAVKQALDELALLTVALAITVNEPGAQIELDGKALGASPLGKSKRVTVSDHKLRVTKAGFEPFEKAIETKAGRDETVAVTLEPEKTTGRVAVREQNARDVRVVVDGEDKGAAPWEGELAAGDHTIELRSERFGSEKRTVKVARKEKLDVALDATPLTGHLRVTAVPASAAISVDGKPVGTGAWDGDVAPGPHHVEVALAGNPPAIRELSVQRGETVVQEIPVISSLPPPAVVDYRGIYVRFALLLGLPLGAAPNNAVPPASDDSGLHVGFASALRIGYAFDPIAVELVGAFMFEHKDRDFAYDDPASTTNGTRHAKFSSNGPNGFLGVGPRITSRDDTLRFTFGLAPGIAFRSFKIDQSFDGGTTSCAPAQTNCGGSSDHSYPNAGYNAFALAADGGLLLGSSPGTKFFLGVHAWIDFPPNDVVVGPVAGVPAGALASPGGGYVVVNSVQFFFGPVIGIQFGH